MNRWLFKSDPESYSAHDLEREGRTTWDGVSNPVALKHLRACAPGDELLVYHTGDEKAIVAMAKVVSPPRSDPKDKSGKLTVVDIEFARWLQKPVTLAAVKADAEFAEFELVRQARLSVMPVRPGHWTRLMRMAGEK